MGKADPLGGPSRGPRCQRARLRYEGDPAGKGALMGIAGVQADRRHHEAKTSEPRIAHVETARRFDHHVCKDCPSGPPLWTNLLSETMAARVPRTPNFSICLGTSAAGTQMTPRSGTTGKLSTSG